jgi:hypothetical protein
MVLVQLYVLKKCDVLNCEYMATVCLIFGCAECGICIIFIDIYMMHTGYPNEKMDSVFCQTYVIWNCLNYVCISVSANVYNL